MKDGYIKIGKRAVLLLTMLLIAGVGGVRGQVSLPKCQDRPTWVDPPWVNGRDWCLEWVINDPDAGDLGYSALAVGDDGTLYATRPLLGQVLALTDENGDGLPDTPQVIAEGLTLPNGLAYYDGALYISGGANIHRLRDGQLETLVDDVPSGAGFWTGGLTIGTDERIYVAVGAACDYCIQEDVTRGAIWSYALDGSDGRQEASGLRQPGDVAFRDGVLWTMDTARDRQTLPDMDELNRVERGADYGWPYCIGVENAPDTINQDTDCGQIIPPVLTFPTHSSPIGLALYDHDTFPRIQGNLIVIMRGNHGQAALQGYAVAAVSFDQAGNPEGYRIIIPEATEFEATPYTLEELQYQYSGFWPRRPLDVAVSPEGWIYISASSGRIYALRPLA